MHVFLSTTLCMVIENYTVHGHGVQHCAWSWCTALCMVMEYKNVRGHEV